MTPELRKAIYLRDGGRCGICGESVPWSDLHIDHVHPQVAGGLHDESNLRATHKRCNMQKSAADRRLGGAVPLVVDSVTFSLAEATERRLRSLVAKLELRRPDVVRMAIRVLAEREGVEGPGEPHA